MARLAAGTRQRADGTLEKRFTVEGKRYSVYGRSAKEITKKEQELRQQIQQGLYTDNRNITLDQYFEEWKKAKRGSSKPNTIKTYATMYKNHISPSLGKKKIQRIERRQIVELQRQLNETKTGSTANYTMNVLSVILNDAMRDEIIQKNPAAKIKAIKTASKAARDTKHRALTESEQAAVMKELEGDYYYYFVALLLCSGMRTGEAAALTWGDIDYKENVIHITKTGTYTEEGKRTVGTPKSEAGKRDIPLTDTIKGVLQGQRQYLYGDKLVMKNLRVFSTLDGKIVESHNINRSINNALKRLEEKGTHIEPFTAHALRDTFATRFIEQGGQPQTLKTILGHSSLSMTMDLYAHVLPNTKHEEMSRIRIAF